MICFRDMTFCTATDCGNEECPRRFDEEQKRRAEEWWGKPGAPVSFSALKDTAYCLGYIKEVI